MTTATSRRFPFVRGFARKQRVLQLPLEFEGDWNLVLMAFRPPQQPDIESWLPLTRALAAVFDNFATYEMPIIGPPSSTAPPPAAVGGWDFGFHDPVARATTVTVCVSPKQILDPLHLPADDRIYVLLVDRQGDVGWLTEGGCTLEIGKELANEISARCPRNPAALVSTSGDSIDDLDEPTIPRTNSHTIAPDTSTNRATP